ncbi:MAG: hypothetical protein A2Z20_09090 [Bdellovibrionales bacterium RBG_16_40_8]|nr:MAG: hypothetical protein A2Z20_09090 [Bdellovibrionales bacterium RBG_16_40_8]
MCRLIIIFFIIFILSHDVHAICVTSAKTNLRKGPGSQNPISWTVAKYTPLIELRRAGEWIEVEDIDGEIHWVYSRNVTRKMVCVAVKLNTAKLRLTPSAQGELADIRQVDRYTPFKRLDVKESWYQVEASWGESYWLHESAVWRPTKVAKVKF